MSNYPHAQDLSNQANESDGKTANTTAVLALVVADPSQPDETTTKHPRSRKVWFWGILTVLLLGGGFMGWRLLGGREDPAAAQAPPPTALNRDFPH